MTLIPISLSEEKLKSNADHWIKQFTDEGGVINEDIKSLLTRKISTTHTFSYKKKTPSGDVIPYKSIFSLSPNNGLLSNGYRELNSINPEDDKSNRNIPLGLKNYVFAYLGMHQPYYARSIGDKIGLHTKPFGVFFKTPEMATKIEEFPHHHATRRDISPFNEEVNQAHIDLEYLLSSDARTITSYQICNDQAHKQLGDIMENFWHYYGNPQYFNDVLYANNSWKKNAEFHYFEKVETDEIAAVLWPVWIEGTDGVDELYSETHEDVQFYSKQFPLIKFITYDLDLRDPESCFIEASYVALRFFLKNNKFPEDISIAKNVLDI